MNRETLANLAIEAMGHAYVPYSGYKVGAALLCADGTVYQGCNIENAAYGPTNCAERTAFFTAVFAGHRDFTDIAVCGGKDGVYKQVRESRGKYHGLVARVIEVTHHRYDLLFDIAHHIIRDLGHSRLGVTVCCRRVSVYATEVTVSLNEGVS